MVLSVQVPAVNYDRKNLRLQIIIDGLLKISSTKMPKLITEMGIVAVFEGGSELEIEPLRLNGEKWIKFTVNRCYIQWYTIR